MNSPSQVRVEIDQNSGFCHGVVSAICKAEEELRARGPLFCLGDIVHNGMEVERLRRLGLRTIDHSELGSALGQRVLLRAHGEPPSTYDTARRLGITIIDATCPVVLHLQKTIKKAFSSPSYPNGQIVIYGLAGHAEVLGLVGQTDGTAIVVSDRDGLDRVDFSRPITLFSQTTMPVDGLLSIVDDIRRRLSPGTPFAYNDTICRQVANRMARIEAFAMAHDLVFFVSGAKSSNGRVLFERCRAVNKCVVMISGPEQIEASLLSGKSDIGICGATSTPKWLMEDVRAALLNLLGLDDGSGSGSVG